MAGARGTCWVASLSFDHLLAKSAKSGIPAKCAKRGFCTDGFRPDSTNKHKQTNIQNKHKQQPNKHTMKRTNEQTNKQTNKQSNKHKQPKHETQQQTSKRRATTNKQTNTLTQTSHQHVKPTTKHTSQTSWNLGTTAGDPIVSHLQRCIHARGNGGATSCRKLLDALLQPCTGWRVEEGASCLYIYICLEGQYIDMYIYCLFVCLLVCLFVCPPTLLGVSDTY